jgi:hypothetical protein
VAFTAGITGGLHTYTRGQTVPFNSVIYQTGGGYNPATGVFTAPKAGLYIIFCTVVSEYQRSFWAIIKINSSAKAGVLAYSASSERFHLSASNLIVYHLQKGDRVWVQLHDGDKLYSAIPDATFSATLIKGSA